MRNYDKNNSTNHIKIRHGDARTHFENLWCMVAVKVKSHCFIKQNVYKCTNVHVLNELNNKGKSTYLK